MAITGGYADNLMRTQFGNSLEWIPNTGDPILSKLTDRSNEWDGQGDEFLDPVLLSLSQSGGSTSRGGHLFAPMRPVSENLVITQKYGNAAFSLLEEEIDETKTKKGAVIDAIGLAMQNVEELLMQDAGRQAHGDGRGQLCQVNGAVAAAGTSIVLDNPGGPAGAVGGARFIRANMVIAAFDPTDTTFLGMIKCLAVPEVANFTTITVEPLTFALPDNAVLYKGVSMTATDPVRSVTRNKEAMGLRGMLSNTGTYFGLNRALFPQLSAIVMPGVGPLSDDLLQQAFAHMRANSKKAVISKSDVFLTGDYSMGRALLSLTVAQRRYTMDSKNSRDPGSDTSGGDVHQTVGGFDFCESPNADYGTLSFVNKNGFSTVGRKGRWLDRSGSMFSRLDDAGQRTTEVVADWHYSFQRWHKNPRSCVAMQGVALNQVVLRQF